MDEYCYKCQADIPIVADGITVRKKKCGHKFSSDLETDVCPECGNSELRLIPKAFLVLWDSDERVREYLTETMEPRTGLSRDENVIVQEIIDKYSESVPECPRVSQSVPECPRGV